MTLLFHGPSGSGKDTQSELLVSKYDFQSIGTGEMFRKMYANGDVDAIRAHQFWSKGLFVPNDLVYKMLFNWLNEYDDSKDWIFVSVVRDVGQIPMFDHLLEKKNRNLDYFVHFSLGEEAAIERMSLRRVCTNCDATYHAKYKREKIEGYCNKCGTILSQREDDKPEKIVKRLQEYNRTIGPILEEYRNRGVLIDIDANPGIEEIHLKLVKALNL
jgi:adenylate kinase